MFLALSLIAACWGVEEIKDVDLRTLDQIEMDVMNEKLKLLKERLEYLHSVEDTGCEASLENTPSDSLVLTQNKGKQVSDKFGFSTIRSNMNALSMENSAFNERTVVYSEN